MSDEVALIDDKRAVIDTKLYDGSITATKDLLALQDEAKMLLSRKTSIEDDELDVMEAVEAVETELAPSVATREQLAAEREQLEAALAVDVANLEADLAMVEGKRADSAEAWQAAAVEHQGSWWDHWATWLKPHGGRKVNASIELGSAAYEPIMPAPGGYVLN